MNQQLKLSVVDQSPMRSGGTAGEALRETIELAAVAEELGYQRYWLAEHHSLPNFAGTSPEVLIGQVAARTKTIRVGSGGVMLPHYSSFKVAENFRMLESLYPGRIDLGIGRAPGSDQLTAAALSFPGRPKEIRHFPRQVRRPARLFERQPGRRAFVLPHSCRARGAAIPTRSLVAGFPLRERLHGRPIRPALCLRPLLWNRRR